MMGKMRMGGVEHTHNVTHQHGRVVIGGGGGIYRLETGAQITPVGGVKRWEHRSLCVTTFQPL